MTLSSMPAPKRITASHLPLDRSGAAEPHTEPAVEVVVDVLLGPEPILGGSLARSRVASNNGVPTSNDGSGPIALDEVPDSGIVLPGGLNLHYLGLAPNTEGAMHRTTSTDYLVVLNGTLSLMIPSRHFGIKDGYGEPAETLCHTGEIVIQRGMMHALSNRTDQWVRLFSVVAASEANRVPVTERHSLRRDSFAMLADAWLP
ncbi:hypothetical protein F5X96DRAFT_109336 [Biscogniauxia mediterranea]|nr:hypothetical protein F5X96DRAFT_109336 [Biscogniauxia mediterranea]